MSKVSISTCGLRICGSSAATEEGDTAWTRRCTFCNVSKSNGFDVVWEVRDQGKMDELVGR